MALLLCAFWYLDGHYKGRAQFTCHQSRCNQPPVEPLVSLCQYVSSLPCLPLTLIFSRLILIHTRPVSCRRPRRIRLSHSSRLLHTADRRA